MDNSLEVQNKSVVLGQIGKVHGLKGWLNLNSFTSPPENIFDYSELMAEIEGSLEILEVDQFKQKANGLIVHFVGYDSPEVARKLTGLKLALISTCLPALENGDYYWHELEGMEVLNQDGISFGEIAHLLETGANDVLVVRPRKDSIDDRERLIPYLKESVIKKIDVTNNEVIVNWEINFLE